MKGPTSLPQAAKLSAAARPSHALAAWHASGDQPRDLPAMCDCLPCADGTGQQAAQSVSAMIRR